MPRILLLLAFSFALRPATAQFASELDDIVSDYTLMGMSVVTVCDGNIDQVYHSGFKDYERDLMIDDSTMFRVASISKTITATGMMLLYDQGEFELDDDISDYLGYTVINPNHPDVPITFEMVLSHRSGLQDGTGYGSFLNGTFNNLSNPPNISELILPGESYYTGDMWRLEVPGTYFAYSNINFGLVATLIEKISGVRFDIFMKENILDPLNIAGSYNVTDIENIDNLAVLYRNIGGSWTPQVDDYEGVSPNPWPLDDYVPGTNGSLFGPQGSLRISALDLARLMIFHLNLGEYNGQQIISQETMELMHEPVWTYNGSNGDNYYGLFQQWGLGIQSTTNDPMGDIVIDGLTMFGHPGEAYGLISDMYFEKESGSGLIFITNGSWNGFAFGNTSAFYTVEEDVFEVCSEYSVMECVLDVEDHNSFQFDLFPNPANDQINILLPYTISNSRVIMQHINGEEVISQTFENRGDKLTLDVSGFASGIYLVEVVLEDGTNSRRKVVIK